MSFDDAFGNSSFHSDFDDIEVLERVAPPSFLAVVQLISAFIGLALGLFGLTTNGDSMHYMLGGLGWLFAIAIPVGLMVYFQNFHSNLSQKGHELADQGKSYDAFAGERLRNRMTKILIIAFVVAIVPIYVLALPLGEALAV